MEAAPSPDSDDDLRLHGRRLSLYVVPVMSSAYTRGMFHHPVRPRGARCDVEMKQEIPDASGEQPSGASQGTAADCRPSTKTNVQRASNGPKGPQARIPDRRSAPRFNRKLVPKYKFDGGPGVGRVYAMFPVLRWPRHL